MEKNLIFVDLTSNSEWVTLPPTFQGQIVRAELVTWDFEGVDYTTDVHGHLSGPYYAQIKFTGALETRSFTNGNSLTDSVQVPLITFDGFPAQTRMPIPVSVNKTTNPRFHIEIFKEGANHTPLTFERCLLWIIIETSSLPPHGGIRQPHII
jgi:hypothetical protein